MTCDGGAAPFPSTPPRVDHFLVANRLPADYSSPNTPPDCSPPPPSRLPRIQQMALVPFSRLRLPIVCTLVALSGLGLTLAQKPAAKKDNPLYLDPINVEPPHIAIDKSVKYDYD